MTGTTPTIDQLLGLPLSERRDALEAVVVAEFKSALFMAGDEELPLQANFFDMGLTSLRLTEVKQRLEARLGCLISANTVFNTPTVEKLMDHLVTELLADVFGGGAKDPAAAGPVQEEALWADVLDELYRP